MLTVNLGRWHEIQDFRPQLQSLLHLCLALLQGILLLLETETLFV